MKTCTKCKTEYPATTEYFLSDKRNRGGLGSWCRECMGISTRKYKKRNPEKIKTIAFRYKRTLNGRLRNTFHRMKDRCTNPNHINYYNYGGRGIQNKFASVDDFLEYVTNNLGYDTYEKIEGLEIDRIDNNGHYEPGNIRFVTCSENCKNKRRYKRV